MDERLLLDIVFGIIGSEIVERAFVIASTLPLILLLDILCVCFDLRLQLVHSIDDTDDGDNYVDITSAPSVHIETIAMCHQRQYGMEKGEKQK